MELVSIMSKVGRRGMRISGAGAVTVWGAGGNDDESGVTGGLSNSIDDSTNFTQAHRLASREHL